MDVFLTNSLSRVDDAVVETWEGHGFDEEQKDGAELSQD
jgi:hypothetical protein